MLRVPISCPMNLQPDQLIGLSIQRDMPGAKARQIVAYRCTVDQMCTISYQQTSSLGSCYAATGVANKLFEYDREIYPRLHTCLPLNKKPERTAIDTQAS